MAVRLAPRHAAKVTVAAFPALFSKKLGMTAGGRTVPVELPGDGQRRGRFAGAGRAVEQQVRQLRRRDHNVSRGQPGHADSLPRSCSH